MGIQQKWIGIQPQVLGYTDYSILTRQELEGSAAWSVETLFSLLGVSFATEGSKAPEYSTVFKMLGLVVDVTSLPSASISLGHSEDRRVELAAEFDLILQDNKLSTKHAERLRGRLLSSNLFVLEGLQFFLEEV